MAIAAVLACLGAAPAPAASPRADGDRIAYERAMDEAKRINRKHLPYVWGGGHTRRPAGPRRISGYDCSGAVSRILYVAGLLDETRTSSGFVSYGRRGHGLITVFVQHGHVFMRIGERRYFGTSQQNPGGGAGFFRPSRAYRAGFGVRRALG